MALSSAQIITLRSFVNGSVNPAIVAARTGGNTFALKDLLNADASGPVKAWRFIDKTSIFRVWEPSELDNITAAAKQNTIWGLLREQGGFDCTTAIGPKLLTDLFPQASASNTRAALLAIATENISVAEQVFGGASATSASPPAAVTATIRTWIGDVTQEECQSILAAG